MKYVYIFMLLIVTSTAFASDEYNWSDECDKNQLSMNICAGEQFHFYDEILNQLYNQQMSYLQQEKYKNYLRTAQRAWIEFRDKDCTYKAGKREDSGSIWQLEHFNCLTDRTKTRIEELKSYVDCRWNGCPW